MNSLVALDVALDRLTEAQDVELAYRTQASKAVARYNAAAYDPHSAAAQSAWTLRKEALGQWKKAREDLAKARADHRVARRLHTAGWRCR